MTASTKAAVTGSGHAPVGPTLLERHRDWLERLIAARTRRRDAVDDILQEVAVAVVRSPRPPAAEAEERPWLCAIAIRQCALFLRKSSRRARLIEQASQQLPQAGHDRLREDPIFWLMGREDAGLLARALAALSHDEKNLLEWKYIDGLTYAELAARIGVARHVAEYRVLVAKKRIRVLLAEAGLKEDESR